MYVDCEESSTELLEPRGIIDMNGDISISKVMNSQQTFPVSKQNLYYKVNSKSIVIKIKNL